MESFLQSTSVKPSLLILSKISCLLPLTHYPFLLLLLCNMHQHQTHLLFTCVFGYCSLSCKFHEQGILVCFVYYLHFQCPEQHWYIKSSQLHAEWHEWVFHRDSEVLRSITERGAGGGTTQEAAKFKYMNMYEIALKT